MIVSSSAKLSRTAMCTAPEAQNPSTRRARHGLVVRPGLDVDAVRQDSSDVVDRDVTLVHLNDRVDLESERGHGFTIAMAAATTRRRRRSTAHDKFPLDSLLPKLAAAWSMLAAVRELQATA